MDTLNFQLLYNSFFGSRLLTLTSVVTVIECKVRIGSWTLANGGDPHWYVFIHSCLWPTNRRAWNKNTRSALIVSNGTPRVRCVCARVARCSSSLFCAARLHRLFLQEYKQFYSSGFYCLKTLKGRKINCPFSTTTNICLKCKSGNIFIFTLY